MKAIFNTLLALGIAATVASCGTDTSKQETANENANTAKTVISADDNALEINVKLNEGKRWEANPETTENIYIMQDFIKKYTREARSREELYGELSQKLALHFGEILDKTTMKGEALNQLHNYMKPMKYYIDDMSSNEPEKAKKALDKMHRHLEAYGTYFQ